MKGMTPRGITGLKRVKNDVFETAVPVKFPTQFVPLYKPREFVCLFLKHAVN
jgi:hypothetical protein